MSYKKGQLIYEGKAKRIFAVEDQDKLVWVEFKDSLTAFNGEKKAELERKGEINRDITSLIFRYLREQGVGSHWVEDQGRREMVCRRLQIVPLEVVVRNRLAGSTAKKFQFKEGHALKKPLVEFYYKDDALGDPFINDEQALMMEAVHSEEALSQLKTLGREVNEHLRRLFAACEIELIDFKLEFGTDEDGKLVLGDEITPDSCRLWDMHTQEKMDKDRFRRDLGRVGEFYEEVLNRLNKKWGQS